LSVRSDHWSVSRFSSNHSQPEHLTTSIVALAEQTNRLAVESAMDAARADARGRVDLLVEHVCRLAVSAGVATGEISWLVGELMNLDHPRTDAAQAAIAGMQACMAAIADAVQQVADRGMPREIAASAEALRRVAQQLNELLPALHVA
jgi:methyl-accepting chemotaxis protein